MASDLHLLTEVEVFLQEEGTELVLPVPGPEAERGLVERGGLSGALAAVVRRVERDHATKRTGERTGEETRLAEGTRVRDQAERGLNPLETEALNLLGHGAALEILDRGPVAEGELATNVELSLMVTLRTLVPSTRERE